MVFSDGLTACGMSQRDVLGGILIELGSKEQAIKMSGRNLRLNTPPSLAGQEPSVHSVLLMAECPGCVPCSVFAAWKIPLMLFYQSKSPHKLVRCSSSEMPAWLLLHKLLVTLEP